MKKIAILICAIIVFIYSIGNSSAEWWHLTTSERKKVEKIGNQIIQTINNAWWCDTKLYRTVSGKMMWLYMNYSTNWYGKKAEIISFIQWMFFDQWGRCNSQVEEKIIADLLWEVTKVKSKKGTFKKYIWANIEARQSSMYTYFYYKEQLINTVKNKVNNDQRLLDWSERGIVLQDNWYLDSTSANDKLDLYHASYLPKTSSLIHFQKYIDSGTRNFFYNTVTKKWQDAWYWLLGTIQYDNWGYYVVEHLGSGGSILYYYFNDTYYYIFESESIVESVSADSGNDELDLIIRKSNWRKYTKIIDMPESISNL